MKRHLLKSMLVLIAALFSFSVAFAETGTETEKEQKNGNKNTTAEGQSYTIDGAYIAGTGSKQASPMTSKGLKFRTAVNGGTLEFTVREGYTITKLYMAAIGNYAADDAGLPYVKVTKVEVDGTEVDFDGGEFPDKNASEAAELTVDNISATQKIVLYFDNSNASAGTQLNASWSIDWSRPDATQPTITVTPETVALVPGATYQLNVHVDPNSFTTQWVSNDETVATVDENGLVTAVAAGTATISNQWTDDATVADAAVITVTDFDPSAFTLTAYDFTAMGDVALTKGESAGKIWNAAQSSYTENEVFWCTNEGLENLAIQQYFEEAKTNTGWKIVDGEGLFLGGGAGRCAAIGGIKAGQIVEFIYTGNHFYTTSKDAGINKTAISEGVGRAIFVAEEDGMIGFELDKGNYVKQINIYSSVVTMKTIGLVPGVWDVDNATFAAYAWNDKGNAWFPFVEVSGAYATQIPDSYTGIVLARINPEGTDADPWNNVWNQTDNIDFTAIADGTVFTITGWGGEGNSTYTTGTVPTDLTDLKATLAKVVELAKIFGYDTTEAEALLASDEATAEQLTAALQTLAVNAKDKANEALALAEAFFNQFDATAAAALAPYFEAAKASLAGDDVDAMLAAAKALSDNALVEGQSAIAKVDYYLRKMNDATVNTDLNNIQAALATNDLSSIAAAVRELKSHISDAATTYVVGVSTLISDGTAAGKDVTAMQAAYSNFLTVALKYKTEQATVVDLGYALYMLIKAVEDYKQANTVYTVAGTKDLTGTENDWDIVEANNMTLTDGLYTWKAENITVTSEIQPMFKVVKTDLEGQTWYPLGDGSTNWVITTGVTGGEGVFTITITFDAVTTNIDVKAEKTGETVGINDLNVAEKTAVIFNMAGQRVAAPVKGINIINGRKVIIK